MKERKGLVRFTLTVVLAVILLFSLAGCGKEDTARDVYKRNFDVEKATNDFYVNDFADLFSDSQKSEMMERAVALDQDMDGIQVVVTTVSTLGSHDIEEYANAMYNQYGIGNNDMGALIILSTGDRDVRIELGRRMEEYVTSAQAGRLLDDYGMDYFKNNQFAEGLVNVQKATIDIIKEAVPSDWNATSIAEPTSEAKAESSVTTDAKIENAEEDNNSFSVIDVAVNAVFAICIVLGLLAIIARQKSLKNKIKRLECDIAFIESNVSKSTKKDKERFEYEKSELRRQYEEKMEGLQTRASSIIDRNKEEIDSLKAKLTDVTAQYEALYDRYLRVQKLYPTVDADVTEMIEDEFKQEARDVIKEMQEAVKVDPERTKVDYFGDIISKYNNASEGAKKYISWDIAPVEALYDESVTLEKEYQRWEKEKRDTKAAQEAYDKMFQLTGGIHHGSYKNHEAYEKANEIYSSLSADEKIHFPEPEWLHLFMVQAAQARQSHAYYNNAKESEKEMRETISHITTPSENDVNKLKKAVRLYDDLNPEEKAFIDIALYENIKELLRRANQDHDEQERRRRRRREEEEARRRSSYHSSSSHHHSGGSSFGGHGGISHGSGASKHF